MDGAMGFSVVETDGVLRATNSSGYVLYERVPKEHMEIADGPSNLMTYVRHTCMYQKLITGQTSHLSCCAHPPDDLVADIADFAGFTEQCRRGAR